MKNTLKNLILIVLIIAVSLGIGYLIFNAARSKKYNEEAKNPIVTIDIENYGQVKMELYPDYAPNTVKTFIKLIENGYYNGKVFHGTDGKAVSAGMKLEKTEEYADEDYDENKNLREGAVPTEKETAKEDSLRVSDLDKSVVPFYEETDEEYASLEEGKNGNEKTDYKASIKGEFVANGYNNNTLRFEYGTLGLYRNDYTAYTESLLTESYDSGSSLFFIATEEDSTLNGQYAAFGKVIEGMDIIENIKALPTQEDENSTSNEAIKQFAEGSYPKIKSISVDTFGVNYGMPKYQEAFDYSAYLSNLMLQYYQNQ